MAIREYGESLLQDVRDRKQAEAQRIRKRQKRGELLGLAGMGLSYLGASKMKSQWDTFTKNEDVMNTNIMINSATKNNKDISDFTNTIKGSGKSQQDYFLDRTVDETLDSLLLNIVIIIIINFLCSFFIRKYIELPFIKIRPNYLK